MKKHYYFAQATVEYVDNIVDSVTEFIQGIFELTQNDDDPRFFLGIEFQLHRELKKSFLGRLPYVEEDQVKSVKVASISHLN